MANLKDVAKLAGVSVATASQALNGKSVNEKTRQKVLECAEKLNYVPNRGGQTLITGKSNSILLVIINSTKYADLIKENTFFYSYMMGILSEAQKRDYNFHLEVKSWDDPELLSFFRNRCRDKSSDGMIIIPQYIKSYGFLPFIEKFPHVVLNPCIMDDKMNFVMVEHEYGGQLVADLVVKKGFKKIGAIHGPQDHYDAECRREGLVKRLSSHRILLPEDCQYFSDFTIKSGYNGASELLGKHPDLEVLVCCNDFVASGVIKFAREKGLDIPGDLAVIGYDNVDVSRAVTPGITTIDAKLQEVGGAMARLLFRQIENGERHLRTYIRPELIHRESV